VPREPTADSNNALNLRLTPQGHLVAGHADDSPAMDEAAAARLRTAFTEGSGQGLLRLGAVELGQALPPVFVWWRDFAARFVAALCLHAPATEAAPALPKIPPPGEAELATLVLTAPMMAGAEYLTTDVLRSLWSAMAEAMASSLAASGTGLQDFLKTLNPAWNLVGRVHFNLAENRRDAEAPFAFMATYTTQLSAQARAQHLPLGEALRAYAGAANRDRLLALLLPVQRAAERCAWLRMMVENGEIYHPLRWSPANAASLLSSAADLEAAGITLRMPAGWAAGRPPRPRVTATIGSSAPSTLGLDGLLDFSVAVTLDGETLTAAEIRQLLAGTAGLALLRGRWVELDRERLERTLSQFRAAQALAEKDGLTFTAAMRLLAGAVINEDAADAAATAEWSAVTAGPWLGETLCRLRSPGGADVDPGPALRGTLRQYQRAGVQWLHLLSSLGLGACLADDMGLGKTVQVLALLLVQLQAHGASPAGPCLLVAPASLLANWTAEIEKFAPSLRARIVHPSAMTPEEIRQFTPDQAAGLELVITSYGTLLRVPVFGAITWRLVILDEAQAIKNPNAKQSRAARALNARARIALTGTPVENRLSDLWSIFDVINPGLLGTARQFARYTRSLADRPHNPYGPLRTLVRPYILRRMKTDRSVIADLPDKTEVKAICHLSRRQAALYTHAVEEAASALDAADGIARKGLVLALLMRLKQICNHPAHWLGGEAWTEAESGKFARLREIAEVVAARQEKMLVFTQFREATAPLAAFLGGIFGRPGLVLHGETAVRTRATLVRRFQEDETVPFFVLTLKAGGFGLTLTAASHVVHFDRWWNPAVENQATDRAFRVGQKRNVLVHKFVCHGTMEDKIDALIESKREISDALLRGPGEVSLTELSNEALLDLVALDLNAVMKD
jgi:SNF2-related domain/SNF2 Helicase protein/Helicase conserved C-terminal domain